MAISISHNVIEKTVGQSLSHLRKTIETAKEKQRLGMPSDADPAMTVDPERLSDDDIDELLTVAKRLEDKRLVRSLTIITESRTGNFDLPIPSFNTFYGILKRYLQKNAMNGWIFIQGKDGHLYPELVIEIRENFGQRDERPSVSLRTIAYGSGRSDRSGMEAKTDSHVFYPEDVARRRVDAILQNSGIVAATKDMIADYKITMEHYVEVVKNDFTKQFRMTGQPIQNKYGKTEAVLEKVINDLEANDFSGLNRFHSSTLFDDDCELPCHPVLRVFGLGTHEFFWINVNNLTKYLYNTKLGESLILPATHTSLLGILTSNLDLFTTDLIEGKAAGNLVICGGDPGTGKTLTAEVYAEIMQKPLYKIQGGDLGTDPSIIERNLIEILRRLKRWNCPGLIDEGDVYVRRRGESLMQNAVCAVMLRSVEYFDGLLWMTTNLLEDIDDAFISRAIAIIRYRSPDKDDAIKVWEVMGKNFKRPLHINLITKLVRDFPGISQRDIKMLFRLALKMANSRDVKMNLDIFHECAQFRALKIVKQPVDVATPVPAEPA